MAAKRRPTDQLKEALTLVEQHGGVEQAARASGIPPGTLQHRYNDAMRRRAEWERLESQDYDDAWQSWAKAMGMSKDRYKGAKQAHRAQDRRKLVIFGDVHCPFQETAFIEEILLREKDADIALVMGDSMDGYSVSRFTAHERVPIEQEYAAMDIFYGRLSETFPEVWRIQGNHDERLEKQIRERLSLDAVSALLLLTGGHFDLVRAATQRMPNVKAINQKAQGRTMAWLAQVGDILVSHAERFSVVPGAALRKIEEALSDNHRLFDLQPWRVLLQAHTHQLGMFPWHAEKWLIEVGCLCQVPGYALSPKLGGRPQRRGYVTLEQVNGVTDINSIRLYTFDHGHAETLHTGS